ncbi:MAG: hypothetical protein RR101_09890, partial [Burkholderiaceae bacterium]
RCRWRAKLARSADALAANTMRHGFELSDRAKEKTRHETSFVLRAAGLDVGSAWTGCRRPARRLMPGRGGWVTAIGSIAKNGNRDGYCAAQQRCISTGIDF